MTPLDIMLWAIAAVIAVAALVFVAFGIWIAVAIVRHFAKRKAPAGDTFVFEGVTTSASAEEIDAEITKKRRRKDGLS